VRGPAVLGHVIVDIGSSLQKLVVVGCFEPASYCYNISLRDGALDARPQEGQQPPLMVVEAAVKHAVEVDGVGSVQDLHVTVSVQLALRDGRAG
jgi:hypothetical protein